VGIKITLKGCTSAEMGPPHGQEVACVVVPLLCLVASPIDFLFSLSLTKVNSTNVLDEGLWIGGKATIRDFGIEIGTRGTQVHISVVEDRYVLLAI
jgi:hypothetical protein